MPHPLLRDPEFRRLIAIGFVGFFVRWMEILVFGVFTYETTHSAFAVASILMLRLLPSALFGVVMGAVATRVRRRSALMVSASTLSGVALALFVVAVSGRLEVWHLALASFLNGVAWAGDNPLRRGLIGDIVGPSRMGKAMALDVGAMHATRLAGPSVGGLLLAHFGMPAVTLAVALLHLAAFATARGLQDRPLPQQAAVTRLRTTLALGFLAARERPRLWGALWVTILFNVFGWPVISMVPVIGQDRLGLGADGIGLLASAEGMGTLLAVITLATLSRPALQGHTFVGGVVLFLLAMPMLAVSTHALTAAAALMLLGIGQSGFSVMQSTLVYVAAPVDRRPQAMGLLTMCIGTSPIGFLMMGWLAEHLGATQVVMLFALCGLLALGLSWPWWRPCLREDGSTPA